MRHPFHVLVDSQSQHADSCLARPAGSPAAALVQPIKQQRSSSSLYLSPAGAAGGPLACKRSSLGPTIPRWAWRWHRRLVLITPCVLFKAVSHQKNASSVLLCYTLSFCLRLHCSSSFPSSPSLSGWTSTAGPASHAVCTPLLLPPGQLLFPCSGTHHQPARSCPPVDKA